MDKKYRLINHLNSVFLYYTALVISFFGHHFRDWLIPTFMVVTILIFIRIIFLNHILLSLVSFDIYCGSFTVYTCRVVFLVVVGACTGHRMHFMDTPVFSNFIKNGNLQEKNTSLVLSKVMSNNQKSNMSTD